MKRRNILRATPAIVAPVYFGSVEAGNSTDKDVHIYYSEDADLPEEDKKHIIRNVRGILKPLECGFSVHDEGEVRPPDKNLSEERTARYWDYRNHNGGVNILLLGARNDWSFDGYYWSSSAVISGFKRYSNRRNIWLTMHEIGHCYGLSHSDGVVEDNCSTFMVGQNDVTLCKDIYFSEESKRKLIR